MNSLDELDDDATTQPICTCGHPFDEHYDDGHECAVTGCPCRLFVEDRNR